MVNQELDLFFQHLMAKRFSEARMMADMVSIWGAGRGGQGRRAALRGILELMAQRSPQQDIFKKVDKVVEVFSKRLNTVWSDEFDQGYYEVWLRFSKHVRKMHG